MENSKESNQNFCRRCKCEVETEEKDLQNIYSDNIKFKEVLDESHQLIAIISTEGLLSYVNKTMIEFSGLEEQELLGRPYWELPWWSHSEEFQNRIIFEMEIAYHGEQVRFEATHLNYNGEIHEIDFIIKPYMDEYEEVEYFIAMGYDITDLVNTRKALTEREKQVKAFFEYSQEGYFFYPLPESLVSQQLLEQNIIDIYNSQRLTRINKSLKSILGIENKSQLDMNELLNINDDEEIIKIWSDLINHKKVNLEVEYLNKKENKLKILSISLVSFFDDENIYSGNFGIIRDITKQKEYEAELLYLANKDSLTGIDNRRTFFKKAIEHIKNINQEYRESFVIMLDIDFFKSVNDTYGHDAGDEVLRKTSSKIHDILDPDYIFGRYGGEEFAAIFTNISEEEAFKLCEKIRTEIEKDQIDFEDQKIKITISIGITKLLQKDRNIDVPLSIADEALYEAKHSGRNRYVYKERR